MDIIFNDESGFAKNIIRLNGYSKKGSRCFSSINWNEKGRINAIAGLRGNKLIGIGLYQHSVDRVIFESWLKEFLLPELTKKSVIVFDNASFHKGGMIEKIITDAGHILEYLPTYSPDLNPIEHKWHEAKHIIRKNGCNVDDVFIKYLL